MVTARLVVVEDVLQHVLRQGEVISAAGERGVGDQPDAAIPSSSRMFDLIWLAM